MNFELGTLEEVDTTNYRATVKIGNQLYEDIPIARNIAEDELQESRNVLIVIPRSRRDRMEPCIIAVWEGMDEGTHNIGLTEDEKDGLHDRQHDMDSEDDHAGRASLSQMPAAEAGKILTAQGSGTDPSWEYFLRGFFWHMTFESGDRYSTYTTGSGNVDFTSEDDFVKVKTGATILSAATLWKDVAYGREVLTWDKYRRIRTHMGFGAITNQSIWFICGSTGTTRHIGFKVLDNVLYGTVANGSSESTLEIETLSAIGSRQLEIVFKPGVECRFYVEGVDKGAITTNLPSGTSKAATLMCVKISNTAALEKITDVADWEFYQAP